MNVFTVGSMEVGGGHIFKSMFMQTCAITELVILWLYQLNNWISEILVIFEHMHGYSLVVIKVVILRSVVVPKL